MQKVRHRMLRPLPERNITPEANFWASKSVEATSEAERSYKELIDIHGEKTIDIVWAAHHACRSSSPCLQAQHSFPVPNSGVIARERPRLRCSIAKRNFLLAGREKKTCQGTGGAGFGPWNGKAQFVGGAAGFHGLAESVSDAAGIAADG